MYKRKSLRKRSTRKNRSVKRRVMKRARKTQRGGFAALNEAFKTYDVRAPFVRPPSTHVEKPGFALTNLVKAPVVHHKKN